MNPYYFLIETLVSIFYAYVTFTSLDTTIFGAVFGLLGYLSIKVVYYLFDDEQMPNRRVLLVLVLLLIFWGYFAFGILLVFFVAINVWQLFFLEGKEDTNYYLFWFSLLFGFLFERRLLQPYFMISFFILLVLTMSAQFFDWRRRSFLREKALKMEIDGLRKNLTLAKQFDVSAKYQLQLEERNVLAQRLHDELGHTLSGSIMQLEALKLICDVQPEKAKGMLDVVTENLREGTDSIRAILKNTKPDLSSLNINSIKMLVLETEEKSGVSIDLIYNTEINQIPLAMWNVIVPNIREALTNMMRYAEASRCVIRFERLNKLIRVSVVDDGVGMFKVKKGLGMRGMDERTQALEGTLIVDGSDGFSVVMLFPIEMQNETK